MKQTQIMWMKVRILQSKCCEIIIQMAECFHVESVDCGIRVLKCCNTPRCRQLGTTKSFLIVLILLAIVHGICDKFLTISAQQAALEHDYDTEIIGKHSKLCYAFVNKRRYLIQLDFNFQSGCLYQME